MKGTEKQINWATSIIEKVIKTLEDVKEVSGDAGFDKAIEAVRNAEYASDIINLFKDYRPCGDYTKDFPKLAAIYRVTIPMTKGEKAILCK